MHVHDYVSDTHARARMDPLLHLNVYHALSQICMLRDLLKTKITRAPKSVLYKSSVFPFSTIL